MTREKKMRYLIALFGFLLVAYGIYGIQQRWNLKTHPLEEKQDIRLDKNTSLTPTQSPVVEDANSENSIHFWEALADQYKTATTPEAREDLKIKVREYFGKVSAKSPAPAVRSSFRYLTQWEGESPSTAKLVYEVLDKGLDVELNKLFLTYLAQREDANLEEKVKTYLNSPQVGLKKAALSTLHLTCPKMRMQNLTEFVEKEENAIYLEPLIQELFLLGEGGGIVLLEKARENSMWSNVDVEKMDQAIARMKLEFRRERESCRLRERK